MKAVKKWVVQDQSLLVQEPKLKPTPGRVSQVPLQCAASCMDKKFEQQESVVIAIHTIAPFPAHPPPSSINLRTQNKWTKLFSWSGFGVPYRAGLSSLRTPVPTVEGRRVGLEPMTINRPRTHNGLLTFHTLGKMKDFSKASLVKEGVSWTTLRWPDTMRNSRCWAHCLRETPRKKMCSGQLGWLSVCYTFEN